MSENIEKCCNLSPLGLAEIPIKRRYIYVYTIERHYFNDTHYLRPNKYLTYSNYITSKCLRVIIFCKDVFGTGGIKVGRHRNKKNT